MLSFAFYDLDRTVTRLPTWSAFLLFAASRRAPWRLALAPLLLAAAAAYQLRLLSRDRLKETMHALLLGRSIPSKELAELTESFAQRVAAKNIRPGARTRIRSDQASGYHVVLATAAHRFYAEAIARRLGIGDVVATEALTLAGGMFTHRLDGRNLYGPAKLAAVRAWLAASGTPREALRVRFYSDHASDAPLLEFADEPFAVNPHGRLRRLAMSKGWPILDWNERVAHDGEAERHPCAR